MKKSKKIIRQLTADDVSYILENKLRETGLDLVPKRLDILDKILTSVDKLAGEVLGYRQEQTLVSNQISIDRTDIDRIMKHINLPAPV